MLSAVTVGTTVLAIDYGISGSMDYAWILAVIGVILFIMTIFVTNTPSSVIYSEIMRNVTRAQDAMSGIILDIRGKHPELSQPLGLV